MRAEPLLASSVTSPRGTCFRFDFGSTLRCVMGRHLGSWRSVDWDPLLELQFPMPRCISPVLLSAWYGGRRPAWAAPGLGGSPEDSLLLPPPRGLVGKRDWDQEIGIGQFIAVGRGIALIGGARMSAPDDRPSATSLRADERTNNPRRALLKAFVRFRRRRDRHVIAECAYVAASRRWLEDYDLTGKPIENRCHMTFSGTAAPNGRDSSKRWPARSRGADRRD